MKFLSTVILLLASSTTILAHPTKQVDTKITETDISSEGSSSSSSPSNASTTDTIDASLVPDFGVTPNTNPDVRQVGSCDGFSLATNSIVNIPCTCPPSRADFLQALGRNVAAGSITTIPDGGTPIRFNNDAGDQSPSTIQLRATAMVITLQNLFGPGIGCPAASAPNFAVEQTTGVVSSKVFVG